MLFKASPVVLRAMVVTVVVGVALWFYDPVSANPRNTLVINEEDVAVGQVLDTGVLVGEVCVMSNEMIEVEVDVSPDEPRAGISLHINENCQLVVQSKFRETGPEISASRVTASSSDPRYTASAKSWWEDFAGIELASTKVKFTYEETDDGFDFIGLVRKYCDKAPWWKTERCQVYSKSKTSSEIKATSEGTFAWKTGQWRHKQRPTYTARANGKGTARCWSSRHITGCTFDCEGSIDPN